VKWIWNDEKNELNRKKHRLSFETACLVFDDPLALTVVDPHPDGDRWRTIGLAGTVHLFVVHTWPDHDPETDDATGRIISARKATPHERKAYEEARV